MRYALAGGAAVPALFDWARSGRRLLSDMSEIHGDCGAKFGAMREAPAASLDGVDVGASVAVYVEDELVVDL